MLDSVKAFFRQNVVEAEQDVSPAGPAGSRHEPAHVAVCALLLELAHADDEFTADERSHIEEALTRHFDLEPDVATQLMHLAEEERRQSVDLYQFTRLIADHYDLGQKMVLVEVMWRVVYADGHLAKHESYLMRKVSHLLGLKPGYLSEARNKVIGKAD